MAGAARRARAGEEAGPGRGPGRGSGFLNNRLGATFECRRPSAGVPVTRPRGGAPLPVGG